MASLPGYGEWILASPKAFWKKDPPFNSLTVDFDSKTGRAEQGTGIGKPPITSCLLITIISRTEFIAIYTFGLNEGSFTAEIDDDRWLDISFTGTLETSCKALPLKTRPPAAVRNALRALEKEADKFANFSIPDAGTQQQYRANVRKFSQEMLRDVRKGNIEPDAAARAADAIRAGIFGLATSPAIRGMGAAASGAAGAPRWGHLGTSTVQEAFGNPTIAEEAWVHFAPSQSRRHLSGLVASSVKSSWARWSEVKSLTFGDLVWQIGPMSVSSESDLAVMLGAPVGARITETKGSYGFKVEGEGIGPIRAAQVIESSELKALAEVGNAVGKSITQLEEQFALQKFGDALRSRPAAPSGRLFDRLTKGEQGQVRLDIIESVMPKPVAGPKPLGKWGKIGRCLLVVAIGISIYKVCSAEDKLKQASREVVDLAGVQRSEPASARWPANSRLRLLRSS